MKESGSLDDQEIERAWRLVERLAAEYKPEWKDSIVEHSRLVHDAALFLAGLYPDSCDLDFKTLRLGAILHDVGRGRAEKVAEHGVISGEIIRQEGFPEGAARIGETHIGVGISRDEAVVLGLPEREYIPETAEERIVCYVDNLLYYLPDENRHEFRDTEAVVHRFMEELGLAYGCRARRFMEGMEREMGPVVFERFRRYLAERNRVLKEEAVRKP